MKIIREILTFDNLLHTFLGALVAGIFYLASHAPGYLPFTLSAALVLYLRELGQVQARYHGNSFLKGWSLAGTDPDRMLHRHMEWIVPSVVINLVALTV